VEKNKMLEAYKQIGIFYFLLYLDNGKIIFIVFLFSVSFVFSQTDEEESD